MIFADILTQANAVLPSYGLAGLVILALVVAHIYIHKENKSSLQAKDDEIKRLNDLLLQTSKDMQAKYGDLAEQQTSINQKVYDMVLQLVSRRRT